MNETTIAIGSHVRLLTDDGPALSRSCGPAVVLALDGNWPSDNRPAAWIRYTSPDGYYRYRSVDEGDLEVASDGQ